MIELRPLKNDIDLDSAINEMGILWGSDKDTVNGDRLEMIGLLIEDYENKHYPISPPNPIDAIKFRMDQDGLSRQDLEQYLGTKSRVSEVLNNKRNLTIKMIKKLHTGLNIPLESLILN